MKIKILKFGGTSVGSPAAIRQVISILRGRKKKGQKMLVVVSAFSGVTDQLIRLGAAAAKKNAQYKSILRELNARHTAAAAELLGESARKRTHAGIAEMMKKLSKLAQKTSSVKECSPQTLDHILSFGERLSAYILSAALCDAGIQTEFWDARTVVKTDNHFGNATVDFKATDRLIRAYYKKHSALQVVTGFIGSTRDGHATTLGRGGSDYSASIFGAALSASAIEIWTDVNGFMTADPRVVRRAFPIPSLTYEEAMEMAYFGAKVIYPPTMQPALEKNIPIQIKNTFNPGVQGTVIRKKAAKNAHPITGISSIHDVAIIRVGGSGMIGVAGTAMRLFGALAQASISVTMITQASSEHSICIALEPKNADLAKKLLEKEFASERAARKISTVAIERDLSIIAVVGENMRHRYGIAGQVFDTLGKNKINVVAIAQGSSELNISAVIGTNDKARALNAIHEKFFFA